MKTTFCGNGGCAEATLIEGMVYVTNNTDYESGAYAIPAREWEAHKRAYQEDVALGTGKVVAHRVLELAATGEFDADRQGMTHEITKFYSQEEFYGIAVALRPGGAWDELVEGVPVVAPSKNLDSLL